MASSGVFALTDVEKQVLLDRYLDIVWVDDLREVTCVRCHRVPIQHYISNCQHLYCTNCRTVFSDGGQWKCPLCQEYVTQLSDQDWQLEDRIYQIKAHCPNKKYGCHYQGQLATIPEHLKTCEDTREHSLPAEFKGMTLDTVANQVTKVKDTIGEMRSEVRDIKANINVVTVELNEQKDNLKHVQEVQKDVKELTVKCETNWKQTETLVDGLTTNINVLIQDLNEQNKQIANVKQILKGVEEIEVRDATEVQQLRSLLQQQQTLIDTNTAQLDQIMKTLSGFEAQIRSLTDDVVQAKETLLMVAQDNNFEIRLNAVQMTKKGRTLMPQDELKAMTQVYEWDISDIKFKELTTCDTKASGVFPLTGYHYAATAHIYSWGHIGLQLTENETNRAIDTTSMPKLAYAIENQSDTSAVVKSSQHHTVRHRDVIRTKFVQFKDSLDYGSNIDSWPSWLSSQFARPPYMVSNRLKLVFYIEPPSIARSFFSNDGTLLWTMDNYSKRKQMEDHGLIEWHESPYFYTSPRGYKVFIRLYLSWMPVGGVLWFVKGEFDSYLTQQFPHRFTMSIVDHTDQSKNLVFSAEGKDAHYTGANFETTTASSLESGGYVKDDSLLIKAVVEPL